MGLLKAGTMTSLIKYGALNTNSRSLIEAFELYSKLLNIIAEFQPDAIAVEQPFVAKNARSAFAVEERRQ
jgi:Holliday junction resolvasome RuvABC endonuclease subunit